MNKETFIAQMLKPNLQKLADLCAEQDIPFLAIFNEAGQLDSYYSPACEDDITLSSCVILATQSYPNYEVQSPEFVQEEVDMTSAALEKVA